LVAALQTAYPLLALQLPLSRSQNTCHARQETQRHKCSNLHKEPVLPAAARTPKNVIQEDARCCCCCCCCCPFSSPPSSLLLRLLLLTVCRCTGMFHTSLSSHSCPAHQAEQHTTLHGAHITFSRSCRPHLQERCCLFEAHLWELVSVLAQAPGGRHF
jgi:hypothetical protein